MNVVGSTVTDPRAGNPYLLTYQENDSILE